MYILYFLSLVCCIYLVEFCIRLRLCYPFTYKHVKKSRSTRFEKSPSDYPTGWYKIPQIQGEITLFEREVIRKHTSVFDAYCPHLGANLSKSKVKDGCLECPFHGLLFDIEDGVCVQEPRMKLDKIGIQIANMNFIWYSKDSNRSEGSVKIKPSWSLDLDSIKSMRILASSYDRVNCYIRDIAENGADVLHFKKVHSYGRFLPWIFSFNWTSEWIGQDETNKHLSQLLVEGDLLFFNKKIPYLNIRGKGSQIGPSIVLLSFTSDLFNFKILQSICPINKTENTVEHLIFAEDSFLSCYFGKIIGQILLLGFHDQFQRDIAIWNLKKCLDKPFIVAADGPIKSFRRWYSQFE